MRTKSVSPKRQALLSAWAREMRHELTASEAALFAAVRGKRLGVVFKRHVPIAGYIVDLLAPSAKLVVEIDGGYHERRRAADARRDRVLQRLGYSVLRLEAELVVRYLAVALERIREALRA